MKMIEAESYNYSCPILFPESKCLGAKCAWWVWNLIQEYDEVKDEYCNKLGHCGGCNEEMVG
jgi:hypothetical protein